MAALDPSLAGLYGSVVVLVLGLGGLFVQIRSQGQATAKQFVADGNGSLRTAVDGLTKGMVQALATQDEQLANQDRLETLIRGLGRDQAHYAASIQALSNTGEVALYEMDAEGNLVHINAAFVDLYGGTYDEVLAGSWSDRISDEDKARIAESGRAALSGHAPWFERFTIRRASGQHVECIGRGYPIKGPDGTFYGFAGSVTPVGRSWTGLN